MRKTNKMKIICCKGLVMECGFCDKKTITEEDNIDFG